MTRESKNPLAIGHVRRWQTFKDPLRDAYLLAGRIVPVFNDLFIRLSEGKPDPWIYIVYSDGHTGTTALESSLRSAGIKPVFKTHILTPQRLKTEPYYPKGILAMYYRHFIAARRPLKVFTMVRNPLDQAVGRFFQNLRRCYTADLSFDHMVELFDLFYETPPPDWISHEVNPLFGIDIYSMPFDREKGYLEIDGGWYKLLLMRLELGNERKQRAVASFIGRDEFFWDSSINASRNNVYAEHYNYFKKYVVIKDSIIDRLMSIRYVKHFYSDAEQESFRQYWSAPRR